MDGVILNGMPAGASVLIALSADTWYGTYVMYSVGEILRLKSEPTVSLVG